MRFGFVLSFFHGFTAAEMGSFGRFSESPLVSVVRLQEEICISTLDPTRRCLDWIRFACKKMYVVAQGVLGSFCYFLTLP
jgi:hypothetical protein